MRHINVQLDLLSRVGLKVTGTAGVPKWVVGANCVEPRRSRGAAGVPIWVTGNIPKLIKRTGFAATRRDIEL